MQICSLAEVWSLLSCDGISWHHYTKSVQLVPKGLNDVQKYPVNAQRIILFSALRYPEGALRYPEGSLWYPGTLKVH